MKTKKMFYIAVIAVQIVTMVSSIANIIFCLINQTNTIFVTTSYLYLVPYYYFSFDNNWAELLVLIPIILISLFLFITSSKAFLNSEKKFSVFIPINAIWVIISSVLTPLLFNTRFVPEYSSTPNLFFSIACVLIVLIGVFMKCFNHTITECSKRDSWRMDTKEKLFKSTKALAGLSASLIIISWYSYYLTRVDIKQFSYGDYSSTLSNCMIVFFVIILILSSSILLSGLNMNTLPSAGPSLGNPHKPKPKLPMSIYVIHIVALLAYESNYIVIAFLIF